MYNESSQDGFGEAPALPLNIAGSEADVLPRIDRQTLCGVLRRLPQEDLERALRLKLAPVVSLPGLELHAACGPAALTEARRRGLRIVGIAEAHDLIAAARGVHGPFLLSEATFGLARRMPDFSARRRLTTAQALCLLALGGLAAAAAWLLPAGVFWLAASLVSGLFFLSVVALRLLCLLPPPRRGGNGG